MENANDHAESLYFVVDIDDRKCQIEVHKRADVARLDTCTHDTYSNPILSDASEDC